MKKLVHTVSIFCAVVLIGGCGYLFFRTFKSPRNDVAPAAHEGKWVTFYYWCDNHMASEKKLLIIQGDVVANLNTLVTTWLDIIFKERLIDHPIKLQSCALGEIKYEAYISFSKLFFNPQSSTLQKWKLLRSLFTTIYKQIPQIQKVMILVNQEIPYDAHFDFSQGFFIDGCD